MLLRSDASHHYKSAHKRFPKAAIELFFQRELPKTFGPDLRSAIADKLIDICLSNFKDISTISPGQILWNAVDKSTRADWPSMRLVPVVLTMVSDQDISNLENGLKISEHRQNVIARITKEAYKQDALLSMRDIGLLMANSPATISESRIKYEESHKETLPHTGNLHDMGSCLTHKKQIIYKYIVDKKDPKTIAKETNHSVKAVDHYIRDFQRVETLYDDDKTVEYIHLVTRMSKDLINQHINIINQYVKERNLTL